jgi:hypothetical protein
MLQSGQLSRAETISKMHSAAKRVPGQQCRQLLQIESSYTRPTKAHRIHPIATSTMTIDCSQLSCTKRCRDRDRRERLYYPFQGTTDKTPKRSHQTTIFESTWLDCTIMCTCIPISRRLHPMVKVRLRRSGFLRTKSANRDQLYRQSSLTEEKLSDSEARLR